jgi:type VI secretion system protein ImpJ
MLLTPHHFQQNWLRQDALLHHRLAMLQPFHYGVQRLKFDPALLVTGILRLSLVEAVMPDGLLVLHPTDKGAGNVDAVLLPHAETLADEPATVYLVTPAARPGSCVQGGEGARWRSVDGTPVVDENTGADSQAMPRLRPRLALHVGDPVPQQFVALPIARIGYRNEQFQLAPYEPPRMGLPPDSRLMDACRLVTKRLREKAAFLAQRLRAPAGSVGGPSLMEARTAIQCLVASLPQFEAHLNAGRPHPFTLFTVLCGVAGHLAPLGPGLVPPVFDPYDHDDVNRCFAPVLAFVKRMLDSLSESYSALAFKLDGNRFHLRMEPAWLRRDLLVGVRLRRGQSEQEAESWMVESLIGGEEMIAGMSERRIRGSRRLRVERDEDMEVLPGRGVLLYRIVADPEFVRPNEVLEISNPSDRAGTRRPAEIVLYVAASEMPAEKAAEAPAAKPAGGPDAGR